MARYHITIIRPEGYLHSNCFAEVVEGLHWSLAALGHDVTFAENRIETTATTILFGAHLLNEEHAVMLPASVVVYNLEQLGVSFTPTWYMQLASRVQIWDYTPAHIAQWRSVPSIAPPKLVEIGYVPQLSRIVPAAQQDIDVLFYGSLTERRTRVLDALASKGLRVCRAFGVYGRQRDELIARAKVVLNLHAADTGIFEVVRLSYLLANRKAVVCESSPDAGALAAAVAPCTADTAVDVCQRLLRDASERNALEQRGFQIFSARTQVDILAAALSTTQM